MDTAELAAIEGYLHSVSGKLSTTVELSGTVAKPEGQANVSLAHASIRGQALDTASAVVAINGNQVSFRQLQLASGCTRVAGSGMYVFASHIYKLDRAG